VNNPKEKQTKNNKFQEEYVSHCSRKWSTRSHPL